MVRSRPAAWPQDSRRLYTRRYASWGVPACLPAREQPALSATCPPRPPTHATAPATWSASAWNPSFPLARQPLRPASNWRPPPQATFHADHHPPETTPPSGRTSGARVQLLLRPGIPSAAGRDRPGGPKSAIPTNWWTASTTTAASAANPVFLSFSPPIARRSTMPAQPSRCSPGSSRTLRLPLLPPPHRTPIHHACPTIPVFAWEFSTLPSETWHGEPRHDWRHVLRHSGRAITHSSFTVDVVRAAMGRDYPVLSVPAPVCAPAPGRRLAGGQPPGWTRPCRPRASAEILALPDRAAKGREPRRGGVHHGRKNWQDMISAFCATFRDEPDATLVLKLTHHNVGEALADMLHHLYKNQSYRCRIVLIHGYLADPDYERLVEATSYVVNTSYGEGQCLPLMEFMSSGKPAVAPRNTAMIDYIDADNAFIVDSSEEATAWPTTRVRPTARCATSPTGSRCAGPTGPVSRSLARSRSATHACPRMPAPASNASAAASWPWSACVASSTKRHKATPPPCKASRHDPRPAPTLAFPSRCGERTGVATHVRSARCGAGWLVPQRNRRTARRLRHRRQDTLLDLGCGEGVATLFAAARAIFTDSEEDKVRSLAQQVEAVARGPSPAWSATATRCRCATPAPTSWCAWKCSNTWPTQRG